MNLIKYGAGSGGICDVFKVKVTHYATEIWFHANF